MFYFWHSVKAWVYSQVVSVYIQAVYVPLDFVLLLRKLKRLFGWFLGVRLKFMPCLSCPLLWIHISAVHLNSIDHKGTRWQTYNELQSKGIGCESGFSLLTTIAEETVKWNSQVTVSRDSGARREAERERERDRGKEEYINRLSVTSLFFQGVRFHSQVYGYLWGLSCLVWHSPGLQQ